jgi:hypothetical protein
MLYHGDVAESRGNNNAGGAVERVTIAEAAALLGCHPNTVRTRVKAGMYRAEKVHTENGPTWMIERASLTTSAPTSAPQQGVSGVPVAQQEALQELAREIVREAGIVQDPEREARLESSKMLVEAAKTNVLLSSGALVGIAAMIGVLPSSGHMGWLMIAVLLICLSVLSGFRRMDQLAEVVAYQRQPPLRSYAGLGPAFLVLGLLSFAFYILYNIPWNQQGRLVTLTRDQAVWGSLVLAALVTAIFVGVSFLLGRKRRHGEDASRRESSAE